MRNLTVAFFKNLLQGHKGQDIHNVRVVLNMLKKDDWSSNVTPTQMSKQPQFSGTNFLGVMKIIVKLFIYKNGIFIISPKYNHSLSLGCFVELKPQGIIGLPNGHLSNVLVGYMDIQFNG